MNALTFNNLGGLRGKLRRPAHTAMLGSALLVAMLVLAGCSVAPTYERPAVSTPATYKEAPMKKPLPTGRRRNRQKTWHAANGGRSSTMKA